MVIFYCIFGYQRNRVFGVPASEMLLLTGGKGNESQIAQNCRRGGNRPIFIYHYMSDTVFGTF